MKSKFTTREVWREINKNTTTMMMFNVNQHCLSNLYGDNLQHLCVGFLHSCKRTIWLTVTDCGGLDGSLWFGGLFMVLFDFKNGYF